MYKKIRIEYFSPFSSIPTADQLFGQIVWGLSDIKGEDIASEFVKNSPIRISSALPEGFFPIPIIPTKRKENVDAAELRKKVKKNKDLHWIGLEDFKLMQLGIKQLSDLDLFLSQPSIKSVEETRVSIDRISMKAAEGQLFTDSYLCPITLVAYVEFLNIERFSPNNLLEILDLLSTYGLGGNKNIGRGNCKISLVELSEIENQIFSFKCDESIFMTLSKCAGNNLNPLSYKIEVYSGIVGRLYSNKGFFNKRPIALFDIGSTFYSGEGEIINNVSTDSKISTYAYAFPVRLKYVG